MKKILILALALCSFACFGKETIVPFAKVPKEIQDIISSYFAFDMEPYVEKDWNEYTVSLRDGHSTTIIEFNSNREIVEISNNCGIRTEWPIFKQILKKLNGYKFQEVTEIERKSGALYEVELDNLRDATVTLP